ncbi:hypothetical protein M3147_16670 [Agromyces mediolanus]|uniref:hypothetical protein n=1 Tax=Agromyces mediolanus TaxID=41986 RepID=UPI00203D3675|nr:hypothetical protein [Agromyces mediolanus]MCM3658892.1 hypothetical protein [Agromyces mediolanus]
MKSTGLRIGAAIAGVIGFASIGTAPAVAAESVEARNATESCWTDVSLNESLCVPAGGDLFARVLEEKGVRIINTEEIVIGGKLIPAVTEAQGELASSEAAPFAATVRAILYDDINYGGGSHVVTASGGCVAGAPELVIYSLHGLGWGDRASSFRTYAGCVGRIYSEIGGSGATYGFTSAAPQLYALNDKGSSFGTRA